MGNTCSSNEEAVDVDETEPDSATSVKPPTLWKRADPHFEVEGLVDYEGNEHWRRLRSMLDDQIGIDHLTGYLGGGLVLDAMKCWLKVDRLRGVGSSPTRWGVLKLVVSFIEQTELPIVLPKQRQDLKLALEKHEGKKDYMFPMGVIDEIQRACFQQVFEGAYQPFIYSPAHQSSYQRALAVSYNQVTVDDFDYMEPLGKGGFGRVVRVRKRSTGQEYAMKIMPKARLARLARNGRKQSLLTERHVMAMCDCPFIVRLDYGMETDMHAVLVLELIDGSEMGQLIREARGLSEELVRFYVAEVALALDYLHTRNMMYRDLKVDNVLVDRDGHVRLVDMGLVRDIDTSLGLPWERGLAGNRQSLGAGALPPTAGSVSAAAAALGRSSKVPAPIDPETGVLSVGQLHLERLKGSPRSKSSRLSRGGSGSGRGRSSSASRSPSMSYSPSLDPAAALALENDPAVALDQKVHIGRAASRVGGGGGGAAAGAPPSPGSEAEGGDDSAIVHSSRRSFSFEGAATAGTETSMAAGMGDGSKRRRMSVVGTQGYIAPEVLRLSVLKEKAPSQSYTAAVDYWALGVFAYKLLTGRKPFPNISTKQQASDRRNGRGRISELHAVVDGVVEFPVTFSEELCSLLTQLLDFDPSTRLGCGTGGFQRFKDHPFFAGLDWEALSRRAVKPPYVPAGPRRAASRVTYADYECCVDGLQEKYGDPNNAKDKWWYKKPSAEESAAFEGWTGVPDRVVDEELRSEAAARAHSTSSAFRRLSRKASKKKLASPGRTRGAGSMGGDGATGEESPAWRSSKSWRG